MNKNKKKKKINEKEEKEKISKKKQINYIIYNILTLHEIKISMMRPDLYFRQYFEYLYAPHNNFIDTYNFIDKYIRNEDSKFKDKKLRILVRFALLREKTPALYAQKRCCCVHVYLHAIEGIGRRGWE